MSREVVADQVSPPTEAFVLLVTLVMVVSLFHLLGQVALVVVINNLPAKVVQ